MKGGRKGPAEAPDHVECEIDRAKFDVGQRVEHRDPTAFGATPSPPRHACGGKQLGPVRPGRTGGNDGLEAMREPALPPRPRGGARGANLGARIGRGQHRVRRLPDRAWADRACGDRAWADRGCVDAAVQPSHDLISPPPARTRTA
jgi:hypothetical protein